MYHIMNWWSGNVYKCLCWNTCSYIAPYKTSQSDDDLNQALCSTVSRTSKQKWKSWVFYALLCKYKMPVMGFFSSSFSLTLNEIARRESICFCKARTSGVKARRLDVLRGQVYWNLTVENNPFRCMTIWWRNGRGNGKEGTYFFLLVLTIIE